MPMITTYDEHPALVAIKSYTVTVTVTTAHRTHCKVVSGLTNGHATACQIADDTAQALAAIWCGKASVQCGPVQFGPVCMGHLPEAGIYLNGQLIKASGMFKGK